jgi:hypothetical protein
VDSLGKTLIQRLQHVSSVIFACAAVSFAATPGRLPTAGQVLDHYVSVTGGAAAWHAKRTERDDIEGRTLDGLRVVLRASVTLSRSGNAVSEIQVPQVASEGIYRGIAWASSHFSGVRIKRGMEREEAIRDSRMLEESDWRDLYPKSQVAGLETVNQERCYKVLLLPSPTQKIEWFSLSSGLLVHGRGMGGARRHQTTRGYALLAWGFRVSAQNPEHRLQR